ncbi:MAG: hypothetical protein WB816_01030 [Methylocystis sp.]
MPKTLRFQRPVLVAIVTASCFGGLPAFAVNLGDIPANDGLGSTCPKIEFLGPTVTAWCSDKNDLMIKSEIDVRGCVNYEIAVDGAGRIHCRARAKR